MLNLLKHPLLTHKLALLRRKETDTKDFRETLEEIAGLMKKHISAYHIEIEKFFRLVIFNYLVCNGDAHLKNFSVFRNNEYGDYTLTPAYDLLNTSLHIPNEGDTALELFKGEFATESYKHGRKYAQDDFYEFGIKIGINKARIDKIYGGFLNKENIIRSLINRSFLSGELKEKYFDSVLSRMKRLEYSYEGKL